MASNLVILTNAMFNYSNTALKSNGTSRNRSSKRLSTGKKINSAADDAAGLAISDKMTAQIRGMDRAAQNCEEGISMVDVADSGLEQVTNMLNRMRELCVQAANGTYSDEDRNLTQKEIDQLIEEVDSTGRNTQYNKIKVLQFPNTTVSSANAAVFYEASERTPDNIIPHIQGICSNGTREDLYKGNREYFERSSSVPAMNSITGTAMDTSSYAAYGIDFSGITGASDWNDLDGMGFTFVCSLGCKQCFTFVFDKDSSEFLNRTDGVNIAAGGTSNNVVFKVGTQNYTSGQDFVNDLKTKLLELDDPSHVGHDNMIGFSDDGKSFMIYGGQDGSGDNGYFVAGVPEVSIRSEVEGGGGDFDSVGYDIILQVASNSGDIVKLDMPYITSGSLGVSTINVTTQLNAQNSILAIDGALTVVDEDRVRMGAYHNRLEFTYAADVATSNNLQDSRSGLEDADMAKEMSDFVQSNVLSQAATSMIAQANQSKNNLLELIRG